MLAPTCNAAAAAETHFLDRIEITQPAAGFFSIQSFKVERCYIVSYDDGREAGTMIVSSANSPLVKGVPCPTTIIDVWTIDGSGMHRVWRLSRMSSSTGSCWGAGRLV
jgi:hypothetical protein